MINARELLADFDTQKFGKMTQDLYDLTEKRYSKPAQTLRKGHPRVCLTPEMLPAVRAAMDNSDCKAAAEVFRAYAETDYTGILGAPETAFRRNLR